jgi:hypothetical protein
MPCAVAGSIRLAWAATDRTAEVDWRDDEQVGE